MHLHFDCASGIAGDMTLGALVDAGGDFDALRAALETLPLEGWALEREPVMRAGIGATHVRVVQTKHEHAHRHLLTIEKYIADSDLAPRAKGRATECFRRLAEAEGAVHRIPPERVHFHEVGAVDAIVDICGAMHLVTALGVESASASAVNTGSGTVECEHGTMPVPAPATAELLRGVPTHATGPAVELTTPTGAAILRTLASEFGGAPTMVTEAIGHGAGTKDFRGLANVLRVSLGESGATSLPVETRALLILSAEIDDQSPEMLAPVIGRGLAAGAVDVHFEPIVMKKGRPGLRVVALAPPSARDAVAEVLFRETSTFGLKVQEAAGLCLRRETAEVETPWGEVTVKLGHWGDEVLRAVPEHGDCLRVAESAGVALPRVYAAALAAAQARWGTSL